jgi:hypothetical protein
VFGEFAGQIFAMTQPITITIPDNLYAQLKRTAELSRRSIDAIVAGSLAHSISPLLTDIPQEYQKDVYPLLEMSDEGLQAEARRVFPADRWTEYESLLEKKKDRPLAAHESHRLDTLRREADILMLRKGYATVLLKQRGYHPPALDELPPASDS